MTVVRKMSTWAALVLMILGTTAAAVISLATAPASTAALSTVLPSNGPRLWHDADSEPASPGQNGNRPAAVAEAHRLFGLVAVPPAWTPVSSLPVTALKAPAYAPDTPDLVDLYQDWTTQGTRPAVQSWVDAHRPVGSRLVDGGSLSDGTILSSSEADGFPTTGSRFQSRQIVFAVAPLTAGRVGIRIDVQIVWYPTRPRAEVVPTGDSTVVATVFRRGTLSADSVVVLAKETFTSPPVVKRLARRVDTLPLALPGVRSCPADLGTEPQLQLVFSGRRGLATITVHDDPDGCGSVTFTRNTTEESPLTDDGLLRQVEKLLGFSPSGPTSS